MVARVPARVALHLELPAYLWRGVVASGPTMHTVSCGIVVLWCGVVGVVGVVMQRL